MSEGNGQLASYVERIERVMGEKKALQEDIKDLFVEVRSAGYDPKIVRLAIKERAMDAAKRQERDALLELYLSALGDYATSPLGQAAVEKVRG